MSRHFVNVDEALAVIACESNGDPWAENTSSGAAGLFQHIPRYWSERSVKAGLVDADIFDPHDNVHVAGWLSDGGRDWRHWTCRPEG